MKTCEDCIHCNVCLLYDAFDYKEPIPVNDCVFFKDKARFIEKPFNIRDHICIITKYSHSSPYEIINCMVTKMRFKDNGEITFSCVGHYANNYRYVSGNFKTSSIGKTVFLTREEAEKKLEEMNGSNS